MKRAKQGPSNNLNDYEIKDGNDKMIWDENVIKRILKEYFGVLCGVL